jgi:transposase
VVKWGMNRKRYSTDLSDREWAIVEPLVPAAKPGGRPCRWERREILNGILYVLRTGGTWRLLPHDFPPWQTVYHYFRVWRRDGTLQRIHDGLRAQARIRLGRTATPFRRHHREPIGEDDAKGGGPAAMTAARR